MAFLEKKPLYSVVVPVYDSADSLPLLAERVTRVFREEIGQPSELIFVDDDSPNPETWPTLRRLARSFPEVIALRLTRNYGQSAAMLCGLAEARGEYVITMDDDLQHPPEAIPLLVAAREHDVVIAHFPRKQHGWFKRFTSRIKGYFDWLLLRKPFHIHHSSFVLMRRPIVRGVLSVHTPYPLLFPLVFHTTRDVVNVVVQHDKRELGRSGYTFSKRLKLFSNLIINNSALLLTTIGYLGISVSFLALVVFVYYLLRKFMHGIGVSGWTSLMLALLGIGGVLLFSIGIIGTYLVRIIHTAESRPSYVVRHDSRQEREATMADSAANGATEREVDHAG
ncbi:MAG: glycosyltransferase [Candidatus Eisenbacteria sp.]|nr:glycosyltransferase [Candidatus Eisenbacteria bacterium]